MPKSYAYVGPARILDRVRGQPPGTPIHAPDDARAWIARTHPGATEVTVTYTVGLDGVLCVADRHSEHVACAGGAPVLGAGELTFAIERDTLEIVHLSNQSTGYCPEPGCLQTVRGVLARAGLGDPSDETAFDFRRCPGCDHIHLIKDDWYHCACGSPLPERWNLG